MIGTVHGDSNAEIGKAVHFRIHLIHHRLRAGLPALAGIKGVIHAGLNANAPPDNTKAVQFMAPAMLLITQASTGSWIVSVPGGWVLYTLIHAEPKNAVHPVATDPCGAQGGC